MPRGNGDIKRERRKRSLELKLPFKGISTNKLYQGRKVRSWFYKTYRKRVFKYLEEHYPNKVNLQGNLSVEMEVGFSSSLSDLDNILKGQIDVLASFYEFNDRQISRIILQKYLVNKGEEFINIKIKRTRKKIDRRGKGNGKTL